MPSTRSRLIAGIVACLLGATAVPSLAADASLDQAMKDLPKYEFGQSRQHLTAIRDALRDADEAQRAKLCNQLTAVLGSGATRAAKSWVCRQLSIFGSKQHVPTLAPLLMDEQLADMARYALERIADPSSVQAMRDALPKAKPGQRIGLINSLGVRRDAKALDAIAKALTSGDEPVAIAAARALAKIGGPKAVDALAQARTKAEGNLAPVVRDAYLQSADHLLEAGKKDEAAKIYHEMFKPDQPHHVRLAALRGIVAAGGEKTMPLVTEILTGNDAFMQASVLRFLREVAGPDMTKALADLLTKLPPDAQVLVLDDFALRADPAALSAVKKVAASGKEDVKVAAVRAMGNLGDASCVPMLTEMATGGGSTADAARKALDSLPAKDVNPALATMAKQADPKVRTEVIRSLGARGAKSAIPTLLETARHADKDVRQSSLKAVAQLGGCEAVPSLVELVVNPAEEGDRALAQQALATVVGRCPDKDTCAAAMLKPLDGAGDDAKAALLQTLPRAGTDQALAAMRKYMTSSDETVRDKAVRGLADWPDPAAAPDLLKIATSAKDTTHHVLALRGYIRLAGSDDLKADARLQMYDNAMGIAKRTDEKRQVLSGLGDVKAVGALERVMPALDDKGLQNEACAAAVNIAKNLGKHGKETVRQTMKKVLSITKNKRLRRDAEELLKKAGG